MKFEIKKPNETVISLARKIGYRPLGIEGNEYSLVKTLSRQNYPRFHIYVQKGEGSGIFYFNLHLDQKQPSYGARGVHAHSGEYFGPVVGTEADRIKEILNNY